MSDDSPGRGGYTAAQTAAYARRKVAESQAASDIAVAGISNAAAVVRELIATAKANPIMGVVLAAVITDLLAQAKVIRPQTSTFLFACIGTAFAVSAAEGVVDIFAELIPWSSNAAAQSNADLIKPVPTTIVENPPVAANQSVPPGALMGGTAALTAGILAA